MATEIERKFLVKGDGWRSLAVGVPYRQGYLSTHRGKTVRVRVVGDRGILTIKGPTVGSTRSEFEYEIPIADALELLEMCDRPLIEKTRYKIPFGKLIWEIDEFAGENQGLILAEVELTHEEQVIDLPEWIAREVSDPKYFNANLVKHPYREWGSAEGAG
ncbi:MAG: CYTH domain-containing protein [Cyanophyceae cyanobacterium]